MDNKNEKSQSISADSAKWHLIDANNRTLGRLASEIAILLQGKHNTRYLNYLNTGDFVVVVNAEKVRLTGKKATDKKYYRHSGFPGGLKIRSFNEMIERTPEEVIRLAVKGMLPNTPLGRAMFSKLKVYAGTEHPHTAQQPTQLNLQ